MPPRVPPSAIPSIHTLCKSCLQRSFSSSPSLPQTKLREQFFAWLNGPGENFRYPLPGSTNYLSAYDKRGNLLRGRGQEQKAESSNQSPPGVNLTADAAALEAAANETQEDPQLPKESLDDLRPFPLNKNFTSQSILSDEMKLEIWDRVQKQGKSVRQVSIEMGVDMRRVGAVVRLMEVERRMKEQGKQLALPYGAAIQGMVPLTTLDPLTRLPTQPHESINDLEQHPLTHPQLFYPTSESRAFNRTDAGRVFSGAPRQPHEQELLMSEGTHEPWTDNKIELIGRPGRVRPVLKPADSRIPHPHLIAFEKDKLNQGLKPLERRARHRARLQEDELQRQAAKEKMMKEDESKKTRIDVGRWQFVVTEVQSTRQGVGIDGRGRGQGAVGQPYGVPSQERKKGRVKIPTKVEV